MVDLGLRARAPLVGIGLVASLLALAFGPAGANSVPDPSFCTVTPEYGDGVLAAPGNLAGTTYTIVVRNFNNQPFPHAFVQFILNPGVAVCSNAVLVANTGLDGVCQIRLRAGGCVYSPLHEACIVTANGIVIRSYSRVKSPDNAAHSESAPSGSVNTADLPFFADEFRGLVPAGCHDYTNDGLVSTADLPFFGDAFKAGLSCSLP